MAIVAATDLNYLHASTSNREDLTDAIYNISPTDTPFLSSISRVKATGVKHEWQTDSLAAATNVAHLEGDDFAGDTPVATTRLDNQCQIFKKSIIVSRTQRIVDTAGMGDAYAYQLAKRGRELKRDIEKAFLSRNGKGTGSTTAARYCGATLTYLTPTTVVNKGSKTVTFVGNGATVDAGDNTNGTYTPDGTGKLKTWLDTIVGVLWAEGSDANVIMCGRVEKENISKLSGIATLYREVPKGYQGAVIGGADLYVSNFGEFVVVPNRFIADNTLQVLDYEYFSVAELDPMQVIPLAKTGDAEKAMIVCEITLECRNPSSYGAIVNMTPIA